MPSLQGKGPQAYLMYPNLHASIGSSLKLRHLELIFKFHKPDTDRGCTNSYNTNIMGKFMCYNSTCISSTSLA
ncbi:hypothetical protein BJX70DRAFT_384960 [Aspergillus crustosus]